MKISLIITVLNEEETIGDLLLALSKQTRKADEIIVCDGLSHDKTKIIINECKKEYNLPITLIEKKGNRSIGRNSAIEQAQYDWIAITDAGCIPKENWLEELEKCQEKSQADVIAGNQIGKAKTPFEEAVIPYVLVMQDKIKNGAYIPATRSVLLKKSVWNESGRFDETLSLNEDYPFFKKVQKNKCTIEICKEAIIFWRPRSSLIQFTNMIYNFAYGDAEAGIIRPKIYFLFFRYLILLLILAIFGYTHDYRILLIIFFGGLVYLLWSITKNKRYVPNGWYWLPVLQLLADFNVMHGTMNGRLSVATKKKDT